MSTSTPSGFASLSMYPIASTRSSWERVYAWAAAHVDGAPGALEWTDDVQASWRDQRLALGMTCGWPLITELRERVRVVGTFAVTIEDRGDDGPVADSTYRSVVIARRPTSVHAVRDQVAAINARHSLSGCISLLATLARRRDDAAVTTWPGRTIITGAHLSSIAAVRDGLAAVASIDALTWAYVQRDEPQMLDGLHVIDRGPRVPCLPLITAASASDATVQSWRRAFGAAMVEPDLADDLRVLCIGGFAPRELDDYDRALSALRRR